MLRLTRVALAICLVGAVALVAYRLGSRTHAGLNQLQASAEDRSQAARKEAMNKLEGLPDAQPKMVLQSEEKGFTKEQELIKLRSHLRRLEDREIKLVTANGALNEWSQDVSRQLDALKGQLRDTDEAYANVQAEAASLRSARDQALDRSASLESRAMDLSSTARNLERRLADDERYLLPTGTSAN